MKKILLIILIILLFLFAFSLFGCDPTDKYTLTVINDIGFVKSCPRSGKYKSGKKWEIRTDILMDAGIYIYANNKRIPQSHFDSDYWGFEFTMPEEDVVLVITMDRFYGKTEYTFADLFYQTKDINTENVDVILESSYNADSKFKTILRSTDEEDINNILSIFEEPLLIARDETIDYNNSETIEFSFIQNGSCTLELKFINDYVFWNDFSTNEKFKFKRSGWTLPRIENESESFYQFAHPGPVPKYYSYDDDQELGFCNILNSIDFKVSDSQLDENDAEIYIDSYFGKIYCINAKTFLFDGVAYEIISQYDFRDFV